MACHLGFGPTAVGQVPGGSTLEDLRDGQPRMPRSPGTARSENVADVHGIIAHMLHVWYIYMR